MKRLFLALALVLVALPAWATTCTLPYVFVPGPVVSPSQVNANFTALSNCILPQAPQYGTKSALQAAATTVASLVWLTGYSAMGDAAPVAYQAGSAACTLQSGAGDGGSQIPSSDGKCWNAVFPAILNAANWNVSTAADIQFDVDASTGTDAGYCLHTVSNKCQTLNYAVTQARKFNSFGQNLVIRITGNIAAESVAVVGPLIGGINNSAFTSFKPVASPMLIFQGDGSGSSTWNGGATVCYTVVAVGYANVGLKNLKMRADSASSGSCQSAIYAETGTLNILADVICGGAKNNCVAAEEHGLVYNTPGAPGPGLTITGSYGGNGINVDTNSAFVSDSTVVISGTPVFNTGLNYLILAAYNSTVKISGNPAFTDAAPISGAFFDLLNGAQLVMYHPPTTWPVGSGRNFATSDSRVADSNKVYTCIGAGAGCPNTNASTGANITYAVSGTAPGPRAGAVQLTAGAGAATSGAAQIGFAYSLGPGAICSASLSTGTGAWNSLATITSVTPNVDSGTGSTVAISWANNGVALTNGLTYYLLYTCNSAAG